MRERKDQRVAVAIGKDIMTKLDVESNTDSINYLYIEVMDVWGIIGNIERGEIRLINIYDNSIGQGHGGHYTTGIGGGAIIYIDGDLTL